jgi:integrase
MVVSIRADAPRATSLKSLVKGYLLTQKTEGKSPATQAYYAGILGRFLWFAEKEGWPDDARVLDEWRIREFLGYVGTDPGRWAKQGNGSESSSCRASTRTVHHYYGVLRTFFNWSIREGFLKISPVVNVKVARPRRKLVRPYSPEQLRRMIDVCERDYQHDGKFLGSRNKALLLAFVDSGLRLSEMAGLRCMDIDDAEDNRQC